MRLFLVSREYPAIGFEVVHFDKRTGQAVLRGQYDDYEVTLSSTGEAARKRKLNWMLERRDDA